MGLCAYIHIAYGGYFIVEYELPQATKLVSLSEKKKEEGENKTKMQEHVSFGVQNPN